MTQKKFIIIVVVDSNATRRDTTRQQGITASGSQLVHNIEIESTLPKPIEGPETCQDNPKGSSPRSGAHCEPKVAE